MDSERLTDEELLLWASQGPSAAPCRRMAVELIERRDDDPTPAERVLIARALRKAGVDSDNPGVYKSLAMRFERYKTTPPAPGE